MTSFYADSFHFISNDPVSVCAFLATSRPIFHSSIIPVTISKQNLVSDLFLHGKRRVWLAESEEFGWLKSVDETLWDLFGLCETLQFTPSIYLWRGSHYAVAMLTKLIKERRYFCRSLKHFRPSSSADLQLVCENIPALQTLDCYPIAVENDDLKSIGRLTLLRELEISSYSQFDDAALQHLHKLVCLEKLELREVSGVTGSGFSHFRDMKNLRELELGEMPDLCDAGFLHLPYLPSLNIVSLYMISRISDVGFAAITKQKYLTKLEVICMYGISTKGLKGLCDLPDLIDLDLSDCSDDVDDECLLTIATMQASLEKLSLGCRTITDSAVSTLVFQQNVLTDLSVSFSPLLTDDSLVAITANLKFLKKLDITATQATDEGFALLHKLPCLEELHLGGNHNTYATLFVTDRTFESLAKISSLRSLELRRFAPSEDDENNLYTGKGLEVFLTSSSITELDLCCSSYLTNADVLRFAEIKSLQKLKATSNENVDYSKLLEHFKGSRIKFN